MDFCGKFSILFLLFGLISATLATADEMGVYQAEGSSISFPMKNGDLIEFVCVNPEATQTRYLNIWMPLTNTELNALTRGQHMEDRAYKGYLAYPAQRFDGYISINRKKDVNHPIDDKYVFSITEIDYSVDDNSEIDGTWLAKFNFSQSSDKPDINSLFDFINHNDVYLRLNSWDKTIDYIDIPLEGKKLAFSKMKPSCK